MSGYFARRDSLCSCCDLTESAWRARRSSSAATTPELDFEEKDFYFSCIVHDCHETCPIESSAIVKLAYSTHGKSEEELLRSSSSSATLADSECSADGFQHSFAVSDCHDPDFLGDLASFQEADEEDDFEEPPDWYDDELLADNASFGWSQSFSKQEAHHITITQFNSNSDSSIETSTSSEDDQPVTNIQRSNTWPGTLPEKFNMNNRKDFFKTPHIIAVNSFCEKTEEDPKGEKWSKWRKTEGAWEMKNREEMLDRGKSLKSWWVESGIKEEMQSVKDTKKKPQIRCDLKKH